MALQENNMVGVRYIGRKNQEIDQWMGTGRHWPYPFAVIQFPAELADPLIDMLPDEFEMVTEDSPVTLTAELIDLDMEETQTAKKTKAKRKPS